MELWNAHRWEEGVARFKAIRENHPNSPWAAEAELHEACYLSYNARYDEAEERFLSILTKYADVEGIRKKVFHYLPGVYANMGMSAVAQDVLGMLEESELTWQERQFRENYNRIYHRATLRDNEDRLCGSMAGALARAAADRGDPSRPLMNVSLKDLYRKHAWALEAAEHPDGYSMSDLAGLLDGEPRKITLADLREHARPGMPIIAYLEPPAQPRIYQSLGRAMPDLDSEPTGHFVVVERVENQRVEILDPKAGRMIWDLNHFNFRWDGHVLLLPEHDQSIGRTVDQSTATALRGGCCGSPPPDPHGGPCHAANPGGGRNGPNLGVNGPGGNGPQGCTGCRIGGPAPVPSGSPGYQFGLPSANLMLLDSPIWYPPGKGPDMRIELVYNRINSQNMATNHTSNYYSFGNKWSCNYMSFLTEQPNGETRAMTPGGDSMTFHPVEGVPVKIAPSRDVRNHNQMRQTDGEYQLYFDGDGSSMYFSTNAASTNGQQLARIEDRYQNSITCQYDSNGLLTNVVDQAGRFLAFDYDANGLVTNITDKLGRNASFGYSTNGNLISMTDMGGYTTTLGYDTNNWVTNIVYPNNSSLAFDYETSPGLGGIYAYSEYAGIPFRIRVVNELDQTNEYFYHAFDIMGPTTVLDPEENEWVYASDNDASRSEAIYAEGVNALGGVYYRTGDQWVYRDYDTSGNPVLAATITNQNSFFVGDNEYGIYLTNQFSRTFAYDTNDWMTMETWYTGGVYYLSWSNRYDGDGNLVWHQDALSNVWEASYNDTRDLLSVTNPLDHVTSAGYNDDGGLTSFTNALTNVWDVTYTTNGLPNTILYPDLSSVTGGYDNVGRLDWVKTSYGFEGSLGYDNMDRITNITWHTGSNGGEPLSTNETAFTLEYDCCGLTGIVDRIGNRTTIGRDELSRVESVTDANTNLVFVKYGPGDIVTNLSIVVGAQTNTTTYHYTSTNGFTRLTEQVSPLGYTNAYDYAFRGWLQGHDDPNGNSSILRRDVLGRVTTVERNTATVLELGYDQMNRATNVVDTLGTNSYARNALGSITNRTASFSIPGFSNVAFTIDYQYDPLGQVTNRVLTGTAGFTNQIETSYDYDAMSRLAYAGNQHAHVVYAHDTDGRRSTKTYGNGDVTTRDYDVEWRPTDIVTENGNALVQGWSHGYNAMGMITSIQSAAETRLFGYDPVYQLTNEVRITSVATNTRSWAFDAAGNLTARTLNGTQIAIGVHNAEDQLITSSNALSVTVTGSVDPGPASNKWFASVARAGGRAEPVSSLDGSFTIADVPIQAGSNQMDVTVTDISGNVSTQQISFTKQTSSGAAAYGYDPNGNLTNLVTAASTNDYRWNAANQLTNVTVNGQTVFEAWYDGYGRRLAKRELIDGQTNAVQYIWEGWSILAVLSGTGELLESYLRGAGLAYDVGGLIAVTHHDQTNVTYYLHNNHRGDVTMVRSNTQTIARYTYSAYGQPLAEAGSYNSRFRFSSKELDASTGLSYFGYRYYSSDHSRWLSKDPIGIKGGLNLYVSFRNSPISVADPLGLVGCGYGQVYDSEECSWGNWWEESDSFQQGVHDSFGPSLLGTLVAGGVLYGGVALTGPISRIIGGGADLWYAELIRTPILYAPAPALGPTWGDILFKINRCGQWLSWDLTPIGPSYSGAIQEIIGWFDTW